MRTGSGRRSRGGLACVACLALAGCAALDGDRPAASAGPAETVLGRPSPGADSPPDASQQVRGSETVLAPDALVPATLPRAEHMPWWRLRTGFRLPAVDPAWLQAEMRRYRGHQAHFESVAERARPYLRHILDRIEARDLPTELALIPVVESGFRPFAYSRSRAGGLWQFKPLTGRRFGLRQDWWYDGRRDVLASTDAALDYLEYLHGFFDGDWLLAIAAYNGGEGTVRRAVRANRAAGEPTDFWHLDLPAETEAYVPRVLALRELFRHPCEHGITLPPMPAADALEVVETDTQVDLAVIAEMAGLSLETLYRYNAGLNRWATPPDGPHRVAVPAQSAQRLRAALAQREGPMVRWQRHAVARGETLSGIAAAHDTTVDALRRANDLRGSFLQVGQDLIVPTASRAQAAYSLSRENRREAAQGRGPSGRERIDYRVRRGDTFWDIARRHDVAVERLASWNDMAPGDPIRPGQALAIWVDGGRAARGGPGERMQRFEYTVRTGDSLFAIAQRFNVTVAAIRRWNDLPQGAVLQPGQRLELRVDVTEQARAG